MFCCCSDANPARSTVITVMAHDESGTRSLPLEPRAEDIEAEPLVHTKADIGNSIGLPPPGKSSKVLFGGDENGTRSLLLEPGAEDNEAEPFVHTEAGTGDSIGLPCGG